MTATQGDLAGLSRFIFAAPRWYSSLAFALVLAAVTGVGAFDSAYLLADAWEGVFFIGIPTVVAGFGTTAVDRALDGQLTPNRSSLLALSCEVLIVVVLAGAGLVTVLTPLGQTFVIDALMVGLASVFAVRLLVVAAVSRQSLPVAAVPASLQTVTAAVLLFIYSGTLQYMEVGGRLTNAFLSRADEAPAELLLVAPVDFVRLAALCLLYGAGVWVFLVVIDRPWQRSLGVSSLDFIRGFVGHIAEGSRELEDFFEAIGEPAIVPVTVLSVRRPTDGGDTPGSEKARFVLPMIHPGPMGTIGGGNLPVRVAAAADGVAFPPHATAGHDFNLVTEREVDTLLAAADRALDRITYSDRATPGVRVHSGEATVTGQRFGDDCLLVNTFSPGCADDVDYAVGLSTIAEARASSDLDDVMLVDAHNCNDGLDGEDLGHVVPGSQRSFDMMAAASDAAKRLATCEEGTLEFGVAWDETPWGPDQGIGPLGVRAAVTRVDGDTTAYVLVDGNNMEPGLRERIVEEVTGVDRLEVVTSDTHIVNRVEAVNQVGEALPQDELGTLIDDLVHEALEDCEPAVAGLASERAEVTVFGNDRTETLASHANAMVSMGGAVAGAIILAVLSVSVFVFLLAGS
jgi:putative membrane protein